MVEKELFGFFLNFLKKPNENEPRIFLYSMYVPGYPSELMKLVFLEYVTTCIFIGFLF